MSNDIQKADQIAYRFYSKLVLVVHNARSTAENSTNAKPDKWFNLETPEADLFRDPLRIYRTISSSTPPPPFELQVLLAIPELSSNQVLVHLTPEASRLRIDPTPQHIVLESWLLHFTPSTTPTAHAPYHDTDTDDHPGDVAPSTIYKHGIPLFRSIYSLLRILPSWKLFKRLRRRMSSPYRNGNMIIRLHVKGVDHHGLGDLLEFDTPPAFNAPPLPYETHTFPPIPHPMGTLSLSAKYLTSPNFQLDELESLLSSRFLSLDEASDFTPTLAKHQARDSMSALAGPSGSLRTSLKSPPSSIAGQFILPTHASPSHPGTHIRTNSMPGGSHSPRGGHAALPISRTSTGTAGGGGSTSALSMMSSRQDGSGAWSKEEGALPSIARLRRESTSAVGRSSLDLPALGPLPIRKPNITTPHPFRSSTLSSGSPSIHSPSPSLRQPSPLSAGGAALPSLPARPSAQTSPNSSRVPPSPIGAGAGASFGIGIGGGAGGSRPSPPFAPSSLSDRRSLTSADGVSTAVGDTGGDANTSPKIATRKRYSSSFGHRYAASGGSTGSAGAGGPGSEGSTGSTGLIGGVAERVLSRETSQERDDRNRERERPRVSSLLGTGSGSGTRGTAVATSDEDELSMFVREIDARKPLATGAAADGSRGGVVGLGIGFGPAADAGGVLQVERTESRPVKDPPTTATHPAPGSGVTTDPTTTDSRHGASGPMLTREAEIDERLRHMHEVFMASLEGLGSGTARRGAQTSASSVAGDSSPVGDGATASAGASAVASGSASASASGSTRPRLGSMRSLSGGDGASSGGSAEVLGRMELDEDARRRRRFGA